MWLMYDDNRWYSTFRMKKETFLYVSSLVQDDLAPSEVLCLTRKPLSVDEQVAIAIYKLASFSEMRVVADVFGVGTSTVQKCFHRFINSINKRASEFIFLPAVREAEEISKIFERICNIPQIIGCIDGSHIPILPPGVGYRDFINRKGWASYVLQAVVDCNYKFRDISCKYPGSAHDAAVFYDSGLFKHWDNALPKKQITLEGSEIPFFIVGDPAYPLLTWLMKNYPAPKNSEEESFNAYMNKARVFVENAFGRLKSRWHILEKRMDLRYDNSPKVVLTCCILHNILEDRRENPPQSQIESTEPENTETFELQQPQRQQDFREHPTAAVIRNKLKTYIKNNLPPLNVNTF